MLGSNPAIDQREIAAGWSRGRISKSPRASAQSLPAMDGRTIVTRGTGYENVHVSRTLTKVLQFMLKVLRPRTIFHFTFANYG